MSQKAWRRSGQHNSINLRCQTNDQKYTFHLGCTKVTVKSNSHFQHNDASQWSFPTCLTAITLATERVCAETLQLNNTIPCKLQSIK